MGGVQAGVRRIITQAFVLEQRGERVDAETVDPEVEPEPQNVEHLAPDVRMAPV
jgi:hypothetical protein